MMAHSSSAPGPSTASVANVLVILFTIGLGTRLVRWIREGGPWARRRPSRSGSDTAWAPREFANEVPVHRVGRVRSPRNQGRKRE
jgi:hypothetical protein